MLFNSAGATPGLRSHFKIKRENLFSQCKTWSDLVETIEKIDGLQGSNQYFTRECLLYGLNLFRSGKNIRLTKAGGLRNAAERLKKQERSARVIKKTKLLVISHTILTIADWLFDNVLYPFVLIWLGNFNGLILMTVLSSIYCFLLLKYYMASKEDWLGVDVLEMVKDNADYWLNKIRNQAGFVWGIYKIFFYLPIKILRLVIWALKKNDVAAFIGLSIYEDAFKTTAFLKHGRKGGLGRRDWVVFWSSILVSNLWWTLQWSVIIAVFKSIFW